MSAGDKSMWDILFLISIIQSLALQIYNDYKKVNPAPMTREQWLELQPELIELRKQAVKDALSV